MTPNKQSTRKQIIKYIAENGGEVSYKTVNGRITDIHITKANKCQT